MDAITKASMSRQLMDDLIDRHIRAEMEGDSAGAVAVYTADIEHDVVGAPHGPLQGPEAAKGFYDHLISDIRTESMIATRRYYGENFCVQEHEWTGTVPGAFLGIPGHGKRISFRMLHLWEFKDGRISRENVWLDSGAIVAQLAGAPQPSGEAQPHQGRH